MFKTQLSNDLIPEKVTIAVLPVITFFCWAAIPIPLAVVVFVLMLVFIPYSIYTIYMAPVNVGYDSSCLFVTDRKHEKIISLKSITRIEPASGYISIRKRWKIAYIENNVEEDLFFYPKDGSNSLTLFIKAVRVQNPLVSAVAN